MICEFITTCEGGKFRHVCRRCGTERITVTEKMVRECQLPLTNKIGVGSELKRLLEKFGVQSKGGCKCKTRAVHGRDGH